MDKKLVVLVVALLGIFFGGVLFLAFNNYHARTQEIQTEPIHFFHLPSELRFFNPTLSAER